METKSFIVCEIQTSPESVAVVPPATYNDRNQAEQAYHQALAAAAVSTIPIHSVVMLDEAGAMIKHEVYYHEA